MSVKEEEDASRTLEFTPTWVVAGVCIVIVLISLFAERFLHYLGKFLKYKRQDSLFQALQKLKEELMLLGFISLLLTVFQSSISQICIPKSVTSQMLPCKKEDYNPDESMHHEIFFTGDSWKRRRLLSLGHGSNICTSQGKVPLLSIEALHQLHIFIFVLAIVHVTFCVTTITLGGFKIRKWKRWEQEIQNEISNASELLPHHNLHHEFLNARAIGYWRKSVVVSWMMSFFKQFHASVTKHDYTALRYGFIMTHCRTNPKFDFHKYMLRALEDDFKKIVGISWYLWLFVIVFLLLDVYGWHAYFWMSFLPLILLLVVGAKLEHIITQLALDIEVKSSDENVAQVKPSDHHFWFRRPEVMLYLAHFILFQNAFEIAYFFWILSTYGIHSCMMESTFYLIPRLFIGLIIQVLCSYSTLPLYAIVTQMGESYKKAIFDLHMQATLQGWAESVRRRKREVKSSLFSMFGRPNKKPNTTDLHMNRMSIITSAENRMEQINDSFQCMN